MRRRSIAGAAAAALLFLTTMAHAALTAAQKCEAAKNKAAGQYARCLAQERGKEVKGQTPDYAGCETKLTQAFTNAEAAAGGACPTTGDVADVQARIDKLFGPNNGLPKNFSGARFVDNLDGTVVDTLTGLQWEKKDASPGIHYVDDVYTLSSTGSVPDGTAYTIFLAALNDCTSNDGTTVNGGFANECDWRLPTIAELLTIYNPSVPGCGDVDHPCIDPVFGPTIGFTYWSSTTYDIDTNTSWDLDFRDGAEFHVNKTLPLFVRAVRGGH